MTEKDYRKEGEEMEKKNEEKIFKDDKVILGIGFTILGLFVLSNSNTDYLCSTCILYGSDCFE